MNYRGIRVPCCIVHHPEVIGRWANPYGLNYLCTINPGSDIDRLCDVRECGRCLLGPLLDGTREQLVLELKRLLTRDKKGAL